MSPASRDNRVRQLLCELLDGELSEPQQMELLSALQADEDLSRRVGELIRDSCVLAALHARGKPASFIRRVLLHTQYVETGEAFTDRVATALEQNQASPMTAEEERRIEEIRRYADRQLYAYLCEQEQLRQPACERRSWRISIDLGEVADRMQRLVRRIKRATVAATLAAAALSVVLAAVHALLARRAVATIDSEVNARWSETPKDENLRAGWMTLEQGYARITFKKGAEAILQGPCEVRLSSPNKMYLHGGRVTARVPKEAVGFTVDTPASRVVDFGTEFGVLAGTGSEVHVFDGKVQVRSPGSGTQSVPSWLTRGQAATVDSSGSVRLQSVADRPSLFARQLPDANEFGIPGKRLSLADIVGGGNGLGTGTLGRGIDPSTGQSVPERRVTNGPNNGFIATPALPFIDGVFVPDGNAGNPIVVTSTGLTFAGCPDTKGICHEVILNGAAFQEQSFPVHFGRLAGRTYDSQELPSIGTHVNAGITFDLDEIRAVMPETEITQFSALCGVSETAALYSDGYFGTGRTRIDVGFTVLVDGRERFSRRLVTVPSQAVPVRIPIKPQDRFLTLLTTDRNEINTCAWAMFAEPALELRAGRP